MKWIHILKSALGICAVAATCGTQGCSATPTPSNAATRPAAKASPTAVPAIDVVVLGDSIATTNACTGCTGFPDLFGRAVARRTGSHVDVTNLAVPDSGVTDLLAQV